MSWILETFGRAIARYLDRPEPGYEPFAPTDPDALYEVLEPGDVLLVEGNSRIAGVIKYLTQSTWSHAALFVGPVKGTAEDGGCRSLIEATLSEGVVTAPLSKYHKFRTRICRPVGLTADDRQRVCSYAKRCVGLRYDLKNIVDLIRYLVPLPVPQRWRRRMIALGSGDPTQLICSGMIAQAFQSVRYPILPNSLDCRFAQEEVLEIRHSSLFVPRDFDISPYFAIVKPGLERAFDYRAIRWADTTDQEGASPDRRSSPALTRQGKARATLRPQRS